MFWKPHVPEGLLGQLPGGRHFLDRRRRVLPAGVRQDLSGGPSFYTGGRKNP